MLSVLLAVSILAEGWVSQMACIRNTFAFVPRACLTLIRVFRVCKEIKIVRFIFLYGIFWFDLLPDKNNVSVIHDCSFPIPI